MNELECLIVSVKAAIESCEQNGKESPQHDNDPFLRGFAAAHRKLGAFLSGALARIDTNGKGENQC